MNKAKTVGERQRQPTEIRRQLIIDAARTVIAGKGLFATTTRDIAAAANVSAGTLTYHFTGIAEILRKVIDGEMVEFYQPIADKAAVAESGDKALQIIIEGFFDDQPRTVQHWRLWLDYWSLSAHDETYAELQRKVYNTWRGDIHAVLARGRDDGYLTVPDLEVAVKDFMAMFDGLAVQAYLPTTRKGPLDARADLTSWVRRSLLTASVQDRADTSVSLNPFPPH